MSAQDRFRMPAHDTGPALAWLLDDRRFTLPVSAVERVLPAVAIHALPDAPPAIAGAIDVQGECVPVLDMRRHLQLPAHDIALTDRLLLAATPRRRLAFFVDAVDGIDEAVGAPATALHAGDLDNMLSPAQHQALDRALAALAARADA
jgi:hypothetical protein